MTGGVETIGIEEKKRGEERRDEIRSKVKRREEMRR